MFDRTRTVPMVSSRLHAQNKAVCPTGVDRIAPGNESRFKIKVRIRLLQTSRQRAQDLGANPVAPSWAHKKCDRSEPHKNLDPD